jgi:hypothetical protein
MRRALATALLAVLAACSTHVPPPIRHQAAPHPKPAAVATTTTLPALPVPRPGLILVGDSVTYQTWSAGLLDGIHVAAHNGRPMDSATRTDTGLNTVDTLRTEGVTGEWVIALGLNDINNGTTDVHALADRVRAIVTATGDPSVTWVVPYSARPDLAAGIPLLVDALTEAGVTNLIRWDQMGAPTDTIDQTHLTPTGMRKYATVILEEAR